MGKVLHHFLLPGEGEFREIVDEAERKVTVKDYVAGESYKRGDYVRYNGELYQFVSDASEAEEQTATLPGNIRKVLLDEAIKNNHNNIYGGLVRIKANYDIGAGRWYATNKNNEQYLTWNPGDNQNGRTPYTLTDISRIKDNSTMVVRSMMTGYFGIFLVDENMKVLAQYNSNRGLPPGYNGNTNLPEFCTVPKPAGAKYVCFHVHKRNVDAGTNYPHYVSDDFDIFGYTDGILEDIKQTKETLQQDEENFQNQIDEVNSRFIVPIQGITVDVEGQYISRTGSRASNQQSYVTGLIEVPTGCVVELHGVRLNDTFGVAGFAGRSSGSTRIPLYDPIPAGTSEVDSIIFRVPKGVNYIRATGKVGSQITGSVMVDFHKVSEIATEVFGDNFDLGAQVAEHENSINTNTTDVARLKTNKVEMPADGSDLPIAGEEGQFLRSLGNGKTEWSSYVPATEDLQSAIDDWMDRHPSAVTTVQDNSLGFEKYTDAAKKSIVRVFDTVADMKADSALIPGMVVSTLGYRTVSDSGDAIYKIKEAANYSGGYCENLNNGYKAELLIGEYLTPEMFGAFGNGTDDDTEKVALALGGGSFTRGNVTNVFKGKHWETIENPDYDPDDETSLATIDVLVDGATDKESGLIVTGVVPVVGRGKYKVGNIGMSNCNFNLNIKSTGLFELIDNNTISGWIENVKKGSLTSGRILIGVTGAGNSIEKMRFSGLDDRDNAPPNAQNRDNWAYNAGAAIVLYYGSTANKVKDCAFEAAFKVDISIGGSDVEVSGCTFEPHITGESVTDYYTNAIKLNDHNNSSGINGENIFIHDCFFDSHTDNPIDAYTGARNVIISNSIFNSPTVRCIEIKSKPHNSFFTNSYQISDCIFYGKGILFASATKMGEQENPIYALSDIIMSNCICKSAGGTGAIILMALNSTTLNGCSIDANGANAISTAYSIVCNGCNITNAATMFTATPAPNVVRIINGCSFEGTSFGVIPARSNYKLIGTTINTTGITFTGVCGRLAVIGCNIKTEADSIAAMNFSQTVAASSLSTYQIQPNDVDASRGESCTYNEPNDNYIYQYNAAYPVFFVSNTMMSDNASTAGLLTLRQGTSYVPEKVVANYNDLDGQTLATFVGVYSDVNF